MLQTLNRFLQRWMAVLTPASLVAGVLLESVGAKLLFLVPFLFMIMTFIGSLSMNFQSAKSIKNHPWTILIVIALLHILMPIWAYVVAEILFADHLLTVGFVLAVAVPTGITSMIWVSICRGNIALCLAIILIDTLLAPFVMPAIMHVIVGEQIAINTQAIMLDLIWMIVIPSVAAMVVNELTKGRVHERWSPTLAPFQKLCLFAVVMINSSAIAPYVKTITWELAKVITVVFLVALSGYAISLLVGHFIWRDEAIVTTVVFTGGMRNIAAGVVIATSYFPAKAVMPVVFGMLFQQVLASFFSKLLFKYRKGTEQAAT